MPFTNLDLRTVEGKILLLNGEPAVGAVRFEASAILTDPVSDEIIYPVPMVAPLDVDGSFSIELPATDDPDMDQPFTYMVTEQIQGTKGRSYPIEVPYNTPGGVLNLADVAQAVPAGPATATYVLVQQHNATVGHLANYAKGVVLHGDDPTVARPEGFASVEWIGSADPLDAANGDTRLVDGRVHLLANGVWHLAGAPLDPNLLWSDEFYALDITRPGRVGKWRANDAWQPIARGYKDFSGNSYNLNPLETLGGIKRTAFSVDDGVLSIFAQRTPPEAVADIEASMAAQDQTGPAPPWLGGILISDPSQHTFRYGYFEFRARWPVLGAGMFPSIWLFGTGGADNPEGKAQAEIDLLEVFGSPSGNPWVSTLHFANTDGTPAYPSQTLGWQNTDITEWHTYGVDWQPEHLRFYRDDGLLYEVTGEHAAWFDTTMTIRLAYSMDAEWFPEPDRSNETTPETPLVMQVDYVRVYGEKPEPMVIH